MPEPVRPDPAMTGDTSADRSPGPGDGTPRWVKVAGIVALVLVVLLIVLLLVGGGSHGPGRHTDGGDTPASVSEDQTPSGRNVGAHTPPAGGHE
jgi:hypothetical protein